MSQLLIKADERAGFNDVFNLRISHETVKPFGQFNEIPTDDIHTSESTFSYDFKKEIDVFSKNPFAKNKKSVSFSENYVVNSD